MKKIILFLIFCLALTNCVPVQTASNSAANSVKNESLVATTADPLAKATAELPVQTAIAAPLNPVPNFDHVVLIILENRDFKDVIGNPQMPNITRLAAENTLLSNYYAVSHPSLPNYIALMSGGTQGIKSDCKDCFVDAPSLADRIETSGRNWRTYQEAMPSPCFLGDKNPYVQKHNPFIYFDSIRLEQARCEHNVVPLTQLDTDLASNFLPNFAFIMPNICNSGHDCSAETADQWVGNMVTKLQSSPALGDNSLIIVTFDEGSEKSTESCCGMGGKAGGKVATLLISPLVQSGFSDETAYSHYSLLKTILTAWGLPGLGQTDQASTPLIEAPWKEASAIDPAKPTAPAFSSAATPNATPSALDANNSLAFPIRAAFYYPWFPQSWDQSGINPFTEFHPTLGFYRSDDLSVINQHIAAMQYGRIQAGIASWWGKDHWTNQNIPALLQAGEKSGFYWSLYLESEGYDNPSVETIQADLDYIQQNYGESPSFLKIDGRFVVFVYADPKDRCDMVDRWTQANLANAYLVMKVFSGYRNCTNQPDAWHQYAPDLAQKQVGTNSFTISPGFWKPDETAPRLERNLDRWLSDVQALNASKVKFQLISTFNEWGEGTAIESADEWASPSGFGQYLDVLHNQEMPVVPAESTPTAATELPALTLTPQPTIQSSNGNGTLLVGAGDIADCGLSGVQSTANLLQAFPSAVLFTAGDNTYPNGKLGEFQNCFDPTWGQFKDRIHPAAGNHDYNTKGASGYYTYFGATAGDPNKGYYSYNLPGWHVVVLNSNCDSVGGCEAGSQQEQWLQADLAANPSQCTLAYWHHPLFSSGEHGNDKATIDLWSALYAAGAELVINGHDHNYERFAPQDPNGNLDPTNGIREIVAGTGGGNLRDVATPYEPNSEVVIAHTYGIIKLDLQPGSYSWEFIAAEGKSDTDSGTGVCH